MCIFQFFLNFLNEPFHLSGNIHGSLENIFLHAGVVRIHFQNISRDVVLCVFSHFFLNFLNEPFYLNGNIHSSLQNIFLYPGVVRIHFHNISRGVWYCVVLCVFFHFFLNFLRDHAATYLHIWGTGNFAHVFLALG